MDAKAKDEESCKIDLNSLAQIRSQLPMIAEEIIEKMVTGRLRKHLAGITLLGQAFVKDGDLTVEKLLKQSEATVNGFDRLAVGEGIEKKEDNFVEEVMAQVKGAS